MTRDMDRVIEAILNIAVKRRHEAVPQAALGEDQKTDAVNLVHRLDDAGKKSFGNAVAVIAAPGQQQIFELIESDDHGDAQPKEDLHEHLEEGQNQILPA